MQEHKNLTLVLAILLSFSFLGQDCKVAFAAKGRETLTLQPAEVNASVINPSKNILIVPNAESLGISQIVTVMPTKKTLVKGKAVKIQGRIENGNLIIDLSRLGPANLIPSGDYFVLAKRGKSILKATFKYNAPTLIVGRLQVPVPDANGSLKARIIEYQTTGAPLPQPPNATIGVFGPDQKPIPGVPTVSVTGIQTLENGSPINDYLLITEVPHGVDAKFAVVKAEVQAPTATGEEQTVVLNAVAFLKDANKTSNIISDVPINAGTDAATKEVIAFNSTVEGITANSPLPENTYKGTVEALSPAINSAPTIDGAEKAVQAAAQVNVGGIYNSVVKDLTLSSNTNGLTPQVIGNTAADLALKAPSIFEKTPEGLLPSNGQNPVDKLPHDQFSVAFFNPEEGSLKPSVEKIGGIIRDLNGILPGSLELPSQDKIEESLRTSGTLPSDLKFNTGALQTLKETRDTLVNSPGFSPEDFKTVAIPSFASANLNEIGEVAGQNFSNPNDISFIATPGSILKGNDPGQFKVNAFPGAFVSSASASKVGSINNSQVQYQTPGGFASSSVVGSVGGGVTPSFIPSSFAQNLTSDLKIFTGQPGGGLADLGGNVFTLNSGRGNTGGSSLSSSSPIKAFDSTKDAGIVTKAFNSLGNQAGAVLGSVATSLVNALVNGGSSQSSTPGELQPPPGSPPQALLNLAKEGVNFGQFNSTPGGESIKLGEGDINNIVDNSSKGGAVFTGTSAGTQSGIQAGVQSGIQAGVQAGVQSGIQAGVQAGVQSGTTGGTVSPPPTPPPMPGH